MTARPYPVIASSRTTGGPDKEKVGGSGARETIYEERDAGRWVVNTGRDWKEGGTREDAQQFDAAEQPAPTVDGKGRWRVKTGQFSAVRRNANGQRTKEGSEPFTRDVDAPSPTLTAATNRWTVERPATTIQGDPRFFSPGGHIAHDGRDNSRMVGRSEDAIRVELDDAAVLQGFPRDYPWQGNKSEQFQQVGNAVPPPLARATIEALVGHALNESVEEAA